MKKQDLAKVIKSVLAEEMSNFKKPTKFETQNDTPEKKEKLDESAIRQAIREVLAEELINEEVYDLVRDVKAALSNNNPSQEDVEAYLKRKLYDEEKEAFGFIKQGEKQGEKRSFRQGGKTKRLIGYKFGQPVYKWVWE